MFFFNLCVCCLDQDECFPLSCDVNAQCLLEDGGSVCRCLRGFIGDGLLCMGKCVCESVVICYLVRILCHN